MSSRAIEPWPVTRWQLAFALSMLLLALLAGTLAAFAFLGPQRVAWLPFERLRPIHVSAALFWILGGGVACMTHFAREGLADTTGHRPVRIGTILWAATALVVLGCHALGHFGGREYWEFPPLLALPLLLAWIAWLAHHARTWRRHAGPAPVHAWMWGTGMVFFAIAFVEQFLHLLPWFHGDYVRDITVQWKSNGSLVGAWNQIVYGCSLFVMARLSGDDGIARDWRARAFFLLGLANLMFNWGHHVYNVPTAGWIRHLSYGVSMTEWVFFIAILRGFRHKLEERRRLGHLVTYRFLFAAEMWLLANLLLAILMSVPAINRYTHGTHVTVAHAMGTTIGINTMLLLGAMGYLLRVDQWPQRVQRRLAGWHWLTQGSLLAFWLGLIAAGALKSGHQTTLDPTEFLVVMQPVNTVLGGVAIVGLGLLAGLGMTAIEYLRVVGSGRPDPAEG